MKQTSVLAMLCFFALVGIVRAQGSNNNHVLFEEFSSSSCPPCAASDPQVELFEENNISNVCVLKWHQNYPLQGDDPFYNSNPAQMGNRANYYGVTGVPSMYLQGMGNADLYAGNFSNVSLTDAATAALASMQNYYQMSVKHSIIGDSIIIYLGHRHDWRNAAVCNGLEPWRCRRRTVRSISWR